MTQILKVSLIDRGLRTEILDHVTESIRIILVTSKGLSDNNLDVVYDNLLELHERNIQMLVKIEEAGRKTGDEVSQETTKKTR
jgi:hypothetical protein